MTSRSCFLLIIIFSSCKSKIDNKDYYNSSKLAFSLIKQCVDTMLNTNIPINTKNYVLDLSSIDSLNRTGVDSFLAIKNIILPVTSEDSVIIYENEGNAVHSHVKQSMIIKIRTLSAQINRKVIVTVSKIKSWKEMIDARIEMEEKGDQYRIIKFQTTN